MVRKGATKKQENLKNGKVRSHLNIDSRTEKEDLWLFANKNEHCVRKRLTEY